MYLRGDLLRNQNSASEIYNTRSHTCLICYELLSNSMPGISKITGGATIVSERSEWEGIALPKQSKGAGCEREGYNHKYHGRIS